MNATTYTLLTWNFLTNNWLTFGSYATRAEAEMFGRANGRNFRVIESRA